jgi:hypothetical protein
MASRGEFHRLLAVCRLNYQVALTPQAQADEFANVIRIVNHHHRPVVTSEQSHHTLLDVANKSMGILGEV